MEEILQFSSALNYLVRSELAGRISIADAEPSSAGFIQIVRCIDPDVLGISEDSRYNTYYRVILRAVRHCDFCRSDLQVEIPCTRELRFPTCWCYVSPIRNNYHWEKNVIIPNAMYSWLRQTLSIILIFVLSPSFFD